MISGNDVRQKFLDFFAAKGHSVVKSASLIPQNDPTLYFTNAGMVPFKNVFTGAEKRDSVRAASSQKCMRVSGKHNDLENVGRTARHHTFFEMLGNFSFGDYFKKEAIAFAWEFLTKTVGLPQEKLWVTVFRDDFEAENIWLHDIGIPKERVKRMDEKDNFWSMGDTGPCGPCSEIIYEQDIPCGLGKPLSECQLGKCDCDRLLEIWNLVFMQFERSADGKMTPLPKPSIDTGMGLERLTAVLQNQHSNYDSDLFSPLIKAVEVITKTQYTPDNENGVSMRVLADHIRASVFLIADGVLPSNEGRGYVLRRIMRRAIRHGKLLGQTSPFFHKLVDTLVQEMGVAYPELKAQQQTVAKVIVAEEERFFETLEKGLKLLSEEIQKTKSSLVSIHGSGNPTPTISGDVAFKLYDTFGFPLDLTQIIAAENGMTVDETGFETCMKEQKERARAGWKGSGDQKVNSLYLELAEKNQTRFLGYDTMAAPGKVVALIQNGQSVKQVGVGFPDPAAGTKCEIIFDQTPFYGEGGGQAGDKGKISATNLEAFVSDTQKPSPTLFVHHADIKKGTLKLGDAVQLTVSRPVRQSTMRNHTATHILHAALRKVLGTHVRQAGSLVNDKILRFDFSHFEAITPEQIATLEHNVNHVILDNVTVCKEEMAHDQALAKGALAFFGDKYGNTVRVVSVGDYSVELCGGTHLNHSSEIGLFKIISEGSIASGVRRIEAVTGEEALRFVQEQADIIAQTSLQLKVVPKEIPQKIEKLATQIKSLEKDIEKLKAQALRGGSVDYLKNAFDVKGVKIVIHQTKTDDAGSLRDLADAIMEKLQSGISVVAADVTGKAVLIVSVSKDLQITNPANKILGALAELVNGRGGGKADRAQAGGTDVSRFGQIENKLREIL